MIYVTHDQIEAMSMGDRIVVMRDGVVQQVDTPLNIYHQPANKFVAGFIGSPTMNFMDGTIQANGTVSFQEKGSSFSLPLGSPQASRVKHLAGKSVTLGIRPEHIHATTPPEVGATAPFTAHIEVVEPVGNEVFVYFTTGTGAQYVARVATDRPPEVGAPSQLMIDTAKLHFFDSQTEQSL